MMTGIEQPWWYGEHMRSKVSKKGKRETMASTSGYALMQQPETLDHFLRRGTGIRHRQR